VEAQKVFRAIDKLQAETQQPWSGPWREIGITESELNSYIAYRIETEKEEIMKELRLKLFEMNRIEGKIHIDLRGQDIPQFIRPEMDLFFAADIVVADGKAKLNLKEIFLGDEPIQPFIIDLIIAVSAKVNKVEATSITDWYELPYGIKNIKTQKGQAIFYY
jgi:DNA-binding ferritin-like protein (Dps family)